MLEDAPSDRDSAVESEGGDHDLSDNAIDSEGGDEADSAPAAVASASPHFSVSIFHESTHRARSLNWISSGLRANSRRFCFRALGEYTS